MLKLELSDKKKIMTTRFNTNLTMILFFLTLVACDPIVQHDKVIQNDSDFDLEIFIYQNLNPRLIGYYTNDTLIIGAHSDSTIYTNTHIGGTNEYEQCDTFADSIVTKILGNDNLHLIINLNEKSNWSFSVRNRGYKNSGQSECRVLINNELIK